MKMGTDSMISIIATFAPMKIFGVTLNIMSLGGLALALLLTLGAGGLGGLGLPGALSHARGLPGRLGLGGTLRILGRWGRNGV